MRISKVRRWAAASRRLIAPQRYAGAVLTLVALLLVANPGPAAAAPQSSEDHDAVRAQLAELLARYESWGFSGAVLVARGGEVVFEEGYGLANRATGERNTPVTRFDFASVAKTFTGAAVLLLEADGALSTDDLLSRHLGAMPERKSSATIHHLATHTAGLAHRTEAVDLAYGGTRAAWIDSMKAAPFESAPGERYRYTNAGFSLLAAMVEEVGGAPFDDFVRQRLFARAGLRDTVFYSDVQPGSPGVALGYLDESHEAAPDEYGGEWGWGTLGSSGIVSTVGDIHRWFTALRGGEILPAAQTRKAFDPSETEAFGWHVDEDDRGRRRIHKGGGLRGMQTQLMAYPDDDLVIVWAHNNMTDNWRGPLNSSIVAVALGDAYTLPPAPGSGTPSRPPAGWYATDEGTLLSLVWSEDDLSIGGNGLGIPAGPLRPGAQGGWVAFVPAAQLGLELEPTADGRITARLVPGDESLRLARTANSTDFTRLSAPSARVLDSARSIAEAFQSGDHSAVWRAQAYRPVRGPYAAAAWADHARFIAEQLGGPVALVSEAWVRRNGSWRYWRTVRGTSGAEAVLRFAMTESGLVWAFGMNPVAGAPDHDELRPIE